MAVTPVAPSGRTSGLPQLTTTSATNVTVHTVASLAAGQAQDVSLLLQCQNAIAASQKVTVTLNDGTNTVILPPVPLPAGAQMVVSLGRLFTNGTTVQVQSDTTNGLLVTPLVNVGP